MGVVTVHNFKVWDNKNDRYVVSRYMTTADRIEREFNGVVMEGTALVIDESELDGNYLYADERPTGTI